MYGLSFVTQSKEIFMVIILYNSVVPISVWVPHCQPLLCEVGSMYYF